MNHNHTIPKAFVSASLTTNDFTLTIPSDEHKSELEYYLRQYARTGLRIELSPSDDELDRKIAGLRNRRAEYKEDLDGVEQQLKSYEAAARKRGRPVDAPTEKE